MNRRAPRSPTPRPGQGNRVGGAGSLNGLWAEESNTLTHPPRHEWQGFLRSPRGFCGNLFGGFLPQPPYFSGGLRRGLTFGLSARRSFGREEYIPCRKERQSLTPA